MNLFLCALSFVCVLAGFFYGALRVLIKNCPIALKLFVLAAGCYGLENLWNLINELTDGYEFYISIGTFGAFGTLLFLFCACIDILDEIKPKSKCPLSVQIPAVLIALVFLAILVLIFRYTLPFGPVFAVIVTLMLLLAVPTAYFSVRLLLHPEDSAGILRSVRLCFVMSLIFLAAELGKFLLVPLFPFVHENPFNLIASLAAGLIAVFAVKGGRTWKI